MAEANFNYYLNRQGVRGPQGIQGPQGFSPIITVYSNTLSEYILQIQTQNNTFLTANLREHKDDLGGTYIRYNRTTGVMYAGDPDYAGTNTYGVVRFATAEDISGDAEDCVVSPANVNDMIESSAGADISALEGRVEQNESDIASLQTGKQDVIADLSTIRSNATAGAGAASTISGYGNIVTHNTFEFATSSQGAKADTAVQPGDLSTVATTGSYDDLVDKPTIPSVGNGTITFTQGGVNKGSFTVNQSGDATIALDAGGGGGSSYTAGTGIDITNDVISVDFTEVATASQGGKADTAVQPGDLATVATSGDYNDLLNKPTIPDITTLQNTVAQQAELITQLFYRVTALENAINGGNSNLTGSAIPNQQLLNNRMMLNSFQSNEEEDIETNNSEEDER